MHPAGLWLGHQITSEVLLLGYPASNGPKEATGELLVPGKCSWESRGCRWMSQHRSSPIPGRVCAHSGCRAQSWHWPSLGTGPALSLRCSQPSDVTSNDVPSRQQRHGTGMCSAGTGQLCSEPWGHRQRCNGCCTA